MNEDHFFSKLCWVCLAEENDMISLLDEDVKMQIDSNYAPIALCDLLIYIVQSEVCITNNNEYLHNFKYLYFLDLLCWRTIFNM